MAKAIATDPDICGGKPVFEGTRITIQSIFEFLAAGDSFEDVLKEFPALKRSDLDAAFDYASKLAGNRLVTEAVS